MTTIITINGSDLPSQSRSDINTNFDNLNTNKIETSVIDTDTSLAANSDSKIPSQKAVKTYIDTNGGTNASTSAKGIVEEATVAEITAGTAAGGTGARLFINPSSTVSTSAGAADEGKVPRLNSTGKIDGTMLPAFATGTDNHDISSTGAQTIAHGLGVIPRMVRVTFTYANTDANMVIATYVSSAKYIRISVDGGTGTGSTAENQGNLYSDIGSPINGTVTLNAPDSTNINLTWSKTGSPTGTVYILWEAYA